MPESKSSVPAAARILGERVRARRTELGLSQEQLAEGSTLHWSFIGRIERGRANLTLRNILRLADILDVDAGALIEGLHSDDGS